VLIDSSKEREKRTREEIEGESEKTPTLGTMRSTTRPTPLALVAMDSDVNSPFPTPTPSEKTTYHFHFHKSRIFPSTGINDGDGVGLPSKEGRTRVQFLRLIFEPVTVVPVAWQGEEKDVDDDVEEGYDRHLRIFASIPILFRNLGTVHPRLDTIAFRAAAAQSLPRSSVIAIGELGVLHLTHIEQHIYRVFQIFEQRRMI
jgi:hypothetical protein